MGMIVVFGVESYKNLTHKHISKDLADDCGDVVEWWHWYESGLTEKTFLCDCSLFKLIMLST